MIIPIILSGGSGTRLWPLSRKLYPKQFLSLVNKTTLFQDTILRLPEEIEEPVIVCNEEHRFLVAEQLRQINKNSKGIILEPIGRNTAPAIALAAINFIHKDNDPTLLVLSSDHLIKDNNAFHKAIKIAEKLAEKKQLVAFGITPKNPETGYGYIEVDKRNSEVHFNIKSFKEKPNINNAKKYLDNENYFWNSGMFMFKASKYLSELKKYEPEIFKTCEKSLKTKYLDKDFIRLDNNVFSECISKSIDYAVMEKTKDAVVVSLDSEWSDIGSWSSLWELKPKDQNYNVNEGDTYIDDVSHSYIYGNNRLISVIGVSDLIIIDTKDALLVANKAYSQKIGSLVQKLKIQNRIETEIHQKVYRPWGNYELIDSGIEYQVKKIQVKIGSKLSLQSHQHRAEHWILVKGKALITCGKNTFELYKNQSTFIPKGKVHRLENIGEITLEIIEIQTGDYLGEDDIVRLEDDYHRA